MNLQRDIVFPGDCLLHSGSFSVFHHHRQAFAGPLRPAERWLQNQLSQGLLQIPGVHSVSPAFGHRVPYDRVQQRQTRLARPHLRHRGDKKIREGRQPSTAGFCSACFWVGAVLNVVLELGQPPIGPSPSCCWPSPSFLVCCLRLPPRRLNSLSLEKGPSQSAQARRR